MLFLLMSMQIASAATIDFKNEYQDFTGSWYEYNNANLAGHPLYIIIDNGNNYTISRMGVSVNLPKRTWIDYRFYPDRIVPVVTIQNYSQINNLVTKVNSTAWYITVPWSASQVKSVTDDLIDMGVFKRTTKITVTDSNASVNRPMYAVFPKVVGGDIRLYFNPQTYSNVVYPLFLTENTITVTNATTQGWTSNVILNGSRWTDDGSLALNLRNDSQLNMSGLVAYWSFDETQGTIIHQVNTESGFVNATDQGTWYGNTTLNYSAGKIGNAGNFDGVDDKVTTGVTGFSSLPRMDSTISFWMKANHQNKNVWNEGTLFGTDGTYAVQASIHDNGDFNIYRWNGATQATVNIPDFLQKWKKVDVVYTISDYRSLIYIDGILVSNTTGSLPAYSDISNFFIGEMHDGTNRYFDGLIDEFSIYTRALSADEIAVLYNTSMRTKAMPIVLNQTAGTGNLIDRVRIVYTGQDASIFARQNGSTAWTLIQASAVSNTWYPIYDQYNSMDFGIELNGNGSNTPFFQSLEWNDIEHSYNNSQINSKIEDAKIESLGYVFLGGLLAAILIKRKQKS